MTRVPVPTPRTSRLRTMSLKFPPVISREKSAVQRSLLMWNRIAFPYTNLALTANSSTPDHVVCYFVLASRAELKTRQLTLQPLSTSATVNPLQLWAFVAQA